MILSLHHAQITIPKDSEQKAREFYCGVLGLRELPKPDELAGRGGFWLEVGDRQVHVGTEEKAEAPNTKAHVAYLVENLEDSRKVLTAHNVPVTDGIQIPGYRRFEFRDPFGNRVEFVERV